MPGGASCFRCSRTRLGLASACPPAGVRGCQMSSLWELTKLRCTTSQLQMGLCHRPGCGRVHLRHVNMFALHDAFCFLLLYRGIRQTPSNGHPLYKQVRGISGMPAHLAWQNDHVSATHLWYAIGTAHCLAFFVITDALKYRCSMLGLYCEFAEKKCQTGRTWHTLLNKLGNWAVAR